VLLNLEAVGFNSLVMLLVRYEFNQGDTLHTNSLVRSFCYA